MKDKIIDFFDTYDFYCMPILDLQFDFSLQTITLLLEDYDDIRKKDIPFQIIFKSVSKYTFNYPFEKYLFEMRAIYRSTISSPQNGYYEFHLLIDMPLKTENVEFTVGEMCIGFADMEVVGGLDADAAAFKRDFGL
jgi:hypothetical protein